MTDVQEISNIKFIKGLAYYAKVLGKPVPNFNKDGFEWAIDVALDKDTVKELKSYGLGPKIKEANEAHDGHPYISFKRVSVKKSGPDAGKENKPIHVVSPDGRTDWPKDALIGNGSEVAVKFTVNEVTSPQKKKFIRADILSMQVRNHIPYEAPERGPEFEPVEAGVAENW